MNEIHLNTWADYPNQIKKIQDKHAYVSIGEISHKNPIYYRGQSNSKWLLQTTLERSTSEEWSIRNYENLALLIAPEIETYTNKNWELPRKENLDGLFEAHESPIIPFTPSKEFWVYLRHHGFPSPLLDWTLSPYIAAFYVFCQKSFHDRVAIFAYVESQYRGKSGAVASPQITVIGKDFRTHKRHFLQQGCYTICSKYREASQYILYDYIFCPHESVFEDEEFNTSMEQDILYKITLPTSERANVLKFLDQFNINEFSLMQTEDSLMRTLAFREIETQDSD